MPVGNHPLPTLYYYLLIKKRVKVHYIFIEVFVFNITAIQIMLSGTYKK